MTGSLEELEDELLPPEEEDMEEVEDVPLFEISISFCTETRKFNITKIMQQQGTNTVANSK